MEGKKGSGTAEEWRGGKWAGLASGNFVRDNTCDLEVIKRGTLKLSLLKAELPRVCPKLETQEQLPRLRRTAKFVYIVMSEWVDIYPVIQGKQTTYFFKLPF